MTSRSRVGGGRGNKRRFRTGAAFCFKRREPGTGALRGCGKFPRSKGSSGGGVSRRSRVRRVWWARSKEARPRVLFAGKTPA